MSRSPSRFALSSQQPVCVLGMHRSGTSLVTGVLKLLGIYLGPDSQLLPPNYGNPKGFWEHRQFLHLNDQVLAILGGSWHELPRFFPGWETTPELADVRRQAQAFITDEFHPSTRWAWKDPRTCLTLPLWKQIVPDLWFIVCVRNPVDTARSLHSRDGFSLAKSLQLWLDYTTAALTHSTGHPRLLIFYEDCIEQPHTTVQRLASFVGQLHAAEQPRTQQAIHEFIDTALQHYHSPVLELAPETRLTVLARALYVTLKIYAHRKERSDQAAVGERERLPHLLQHFAAYCQQAQADLNHAQHQTQQEIARLSQLVTAHQETHSSTQTELAKVRQQLVIRESELTTQQRMLREVRAQLDTRTAEIKALRQTLTDTQEQLTAREAEHTVLQQALLETQEKVGQQEHDLHGLRQQLSHEQTTVRATQTSLCHTTHQLGQWQRKALTLAAELERFRQRRFTRWLARIKPGQDLSDAVSPAFQQLKDDSLLFTPDLHGFRLQPSANLADVPFLAYPLNTQHTNLRGILLAVITDLPPRHGEFGIEILSPANTIVVQRTVACTEIEDQTPVRLEFPAVPGSDQAGFWLRVFVRSVTEPIRIFEWQKYRWAGLGRLHTRAFCGFVFG